MYVIGYVYLLIMVITFLGQNRTCSRLLNICILSTKNNWAISGRHKIICRNSNTYHLHISSAWLIFSRLLYGWISQGWTLNNWRLLNRPSSILICLILKSTNTIITAISLFLRIQILIMPINIIIHKRLESIRLLQINTIGSFALSYISVYWHNNMILLNGHSNDIFWFNLLLIVYVF